MATESERCVDELLVKLNAIDNLIQQFEQGQTSLNAIDEARKIVVDAQKYVDNNKTLIPSYCLKKIADSSRKLETLFIQPQKTTLLSFKFKPPQRDLVSNSSHKLEPESASAVKEKEPLALPTFFGFENEVAKELSLKATEVESKDISLVNLNNCVVKINGFANTIYIRNLHDTKVIVCLASRAITVTNCTKCEFKFVCQQLRIDSTKESDFEIFTSARSMLESSTRLRFKGLDITQFEGVNELFGRANFNESENNWKCIDDFDWLSSNKPSVNFMLVED